MTKRLLTGRRSALNIAAICLGLLAAVGMFCWPLFASREIAQQSGLAQAGFTLLMPALVALVLVQVTNGRLDSRRLAVLGVLAALASVIRMLGAGTAGIETIFFLILIGGFVFGADFGFLLGSTSLLTSALFTGGFGPWLPFQMVAAGLVGLGAGLLPKTLNPRVTLGAYAIVSSFVYGGLMTMWNWPFIAGTETSFGWVAGGGPLLNLQHFVTYELFTGGLLWDSGRAATTAILIWLTAPALIATLNRAATRAGFER